MSLWVILGAWTAVACTFLIFSFLYKDNPLYRVGEVLFIGVAMGYGAMRNWYDSLLPKLVRPLLDEGDPVLWVPAIMTLLLFMRFLKPVSWMSRYTFAALMGLVSGLAIPRFITSNILAQIGGTVKPLIASNGTWGWPEFNAFMILAGMLSVLVYFFFSVEHKGVVKGIATVGIYFLMIAFGASFGFTVMGRISLLIGVCYDLINYSHKDYAYATPILLATTALFLLLWERKDRKRASAS